MTRSDSSLESLMGQVTSEFFERLSRSENPQIDEYADKYPEIAQLIRDTFPALKLMRGAVVNEDMSRTQLEDGRVAANQQVGDFRILREIGRGGMGVVYEARQMSLDRTVALKVLPLVTILDEKAVQRFKNEAKAAATLNHPHIVPVYAVGHDRGIYYYAMPLIDGPTIAEMIAELRNQGSPSGNGCPSLDQALRKLNEESTRKSVDTLRDVGQSGETGGEAVGKRRRFQASVSPWRLSSNSNFFRNVARIGQQAAEALHCAHEHGIVHRDIKPGNLMIDGRGKLWVTDFGLARIESDAGMTITGDLVGTLRYMSPEQALARRVIVDSRADIYSLGITMYEFLTFRPAFEELDRKRLLRQIAFDEPQSPRSINASVPRDLQTIILKAMSKDPEERYATAEEMADDLRRFRIDEPIFAKPPSVAARIRKWSRRHVEIVGTALVASICLVVVLAVATLIVLSGRRALRQQREVALRESKRAVAASVIAQKQTIASQAAEAWSRTLLYAADMKLASDAMTSGDAARSSELVTRHGASISDNLRGFEWYYLRNRTSPSFTVELNPGGEVSDVEVSPDGNRVAAAAAAGKIVIYDTTEWRTCHSLSASDTSVNGLDWSADGGMLAASCGNGNLLVWDSDSGRRCLEIPAHAGEANDVCFDPTGRHLYSCGDDGLVKRWDLDTGRHLREFSGHQREVERIAVSPDGRLLATASSDHHIGVWNVSTAERLHYMNTHSGRVVCIAVSADGHLVAASTIRDRRFSSMYEAANTCRCQGSRMVWKLCASGMDGWSPVIVEAQSNCGRDLRHWTKYPLRLLGRLGGWRTPDARLRYHRLRMGMD